jgi:hypothetical protein
MEFELTIVIILCGLVFPPALYILWKAWQPLLADCWLVCRHGRQRARSIQELRRFEVLSDEETGTVIHPLSSAPLSMSRQPPRGELAVTESSPAAAAAAAAAAAESSTVTTGSDKRTLVVISPSPEPSPSKKSMCAPRLQPLACADDSSSRSSVDWAEMWQYEREYDPTSKVRKGLRGEERRCASAVRHY